MRFGLKVPSSKPRLLANGKRGLQNPYFDPKNGLKNLHYHVCQLFLWVRILHSETCIEVVESHALPVTLCYCRYQLKNLGKM